MYSKPSLGVEWHLQVLFCVSFFLFEIKGLKATYGCTKITFNKTNLWYTYQQLALQERWPRLSHALALELDEGKVPNI